MNIFQIKNANRKWYEIVLWWEIRRIPYNLFMYLIGLLSFYIFYVTIPLVYLVIALLLNFFYTLGWVSELLFFNSMSDILKLKYPGIAFMIYLTFSTLLVVGFSLFLIN